MPLIRSSDQKSQSLEAFYQELTNESSSVVEKAIGTAMLSFIEMVNQTFKQTTLYGLTSHYRLIIQKSESWKGDWYVAVHSIGDGNFQFEYKMPESSSPWKYAAVTGQANTIEDAKEYLVIAMVESEGWEDNKELRKLYNKLKNRQTPPTNFKLWLEFEEVEPGNWDKNNGFCNIHVDLEDGRHYGLNVWTYQFLETAINFDKQQNNNLDGLYQIPPDLLVKELTRDCIEQSIRHLLTQGDLEQVLNPSVLSKRSIQ
ncbi:MAG: hypothetical protein WCF67_12430 [Chitinophagaceae bacterium]